MCLRAPAPARKHARTLAHAHALALAKTHTDVLDKSERVGAERESGGDGVCLRVCTRA